MLSKVILQLCHLNGEFYDYIDREWISGWDGNAGFLINIVFAALFLGVEIPPLKKVWHSSSNQLVYGMFVAWSQWAVALAFTGFLLVPIFGVNELYGVSIPFGFSGFVLFFFWLFGFYF